jgi:alkylresorcinol/alkylpyrone synthase
MTSIAGVCAVPAPYRYRQRDITRTFADIVVGNGERRAVVERLHRSTTVTHRNFALPLTDYGSLKDFGEANDVFIRVGLDLGAQAITGALAQAGFAAEDVDVIVTTSVTGIAVPSLDARLVGRLGLRPDVRRIPLFGLGCVAGAAGIARAHDVLRGNPDGVVVLLAVELCSLTVQRDDASMPNLVASGLFADGAAAVVMVGQRRASLLGDPTLHVVASRSRMYPETDRVMGWDVGSSGLRIVLSATVAEVVERYLAEDISNFLHDYGLTVPDIRHWVSHPGGPKVLEAVQASLGLSETALDYSWRSLRETGNQSSVSVLHVLQETLRDHPAGVVFSAGNAPQPVDASAGEFGVMLAFGPGFCLEMVLLKWL